MVKVCAELLVPWVVMGKEKAAGDSVTAGVGATPAPFRARVWGLPGALSETWRIADNGPTLTGVKVMLTEQFALGASVGVHVLDWEKLEAFEPTMELGS